MNKTAINCLTLVSLGALAGCGGSSSNGGPSVGVVPNATGYFAVAEGDNILGAGDAEGRFEINDDDSVTVTVTEGADAGESATFTPIDDDEYVADLGDGAEAYMLMGYFDDDTINGGEPVVALITADGDDDQDVALAFRSTDGMTSEMPVSGTAYYSGGHEGVAAVPGVSAERISGGFEALVDFGDASLEGALETDYGDVVFDGTISGSEFASDTGSITLHGDSDVVNQDASAVAGAFYGDDAAGMAGTYLLEGQNDLDGVGAMGAFLAEKGDRPL